MNRSELIALFDQDQRVEVEYPGMRREVTPEVVRHVQTTDQGEGMVIFSRLEEANAEAVIRAQVDFFKGIGQDFEWKLFDYDQPPDLKDRLAALGFAIEEAEALMVLDLEQAPEVLWRPVVQDVRRITETGRLGDVQAIQQQVWDEDSSWVKSYLGGALRNYPSQMSVYAAYSEGRPVSAAWIYFPARSQFASLWGGATVSGFRKQGLYTALLAVRAQEARARRVRFLSVEASPMSRPILENFGFQMLAYSYPCMWRVASGR